MKILIKKIRQQKNITIRQLAALSGISKTELSDIETGKKIPTAYTLCAIAKALQVTLCKLVDCDND
jgi:transcriptional regulator with XRE-family HTH domain